MSVATYIALMVHRSLHMSLHVNLPTEVIAILWVSLVMHVYALNKIESYMLVYKLISPYCISEPARGFMYLLYMRVNPGCSGSPTSSLSGDGYLLPDVWPEWIEGAERSCLDLWPALSIPIAKAILILIHTVGETSVLPFS